MSWDYSDGQLFVVLDLNQPIGPVGVVALVGVMAFSPLIGMYLEALYKRLTYDPLSGCTSAQLRCELKRREQAGITDGEIGGEG